VCRGWTSAGMVCHCRPRISRVRHAHAGVEEIARANIRGGKSGSGSIRLCDRRACLRLLPFALADAVGHSTREYIPKTGTSWARHRLNACLAMEHGGDGRPSRTFLHSEKGTTVANTHTHTDATHTTISFPHMLFC
jgi:hypothetical protein